ncbi:MAG: hypothetical protein ACREOS_12420 [Candidatus Dormibacteraceae bacterium]
MITATAGITNVRVVLTGQPTHMAFPDKGRSVLDDLRYLLDALPHLEISFDRRRYGDGLEPRWTVGYINGGYEYRAGLFLGSRLRGDQLRLLGRLREGTFPLPTHAHGAWRRPFETNLERTAVTCPAWARKSATKVSLNPVGTGFMA